MNPGDENWIRLKGLEAKALTAVTFEGAPEPVSYTHLDVYKRQAPVKEKQRTVNTGCSIFAAVFYFSNL